MNVRRMHFTFPTMILLAQLKFLVFFVVISSLIIKCLWISFRKLQSLFINIFQEQMTTNFNVGGERFDGSLISRLLICSSDLLELLPIYALPIIFISFSNFFDLKLGLCNTKNLWLFSSFSSSSDDIISYTNTDRKSFFVLESNNDSATWFWRLFFLLWSFWKINNDNDNYKIGEKIPIAEKIKVSKTKVTYMSYIITILFWIIIFIGAPKS